MTTDILKELLTDAIRESPYLGNALIIDDIVNDALIIKLRDYEITLKYYIEKKIKKASL